MIRRLLEFIDNHAILVITVSLGGAFALLAIASAMMIDSPARLYRVH